MDIKKLLPMPLVFFVVTSVNAQPPGPPFSGPIDANVLNFPNVQTVDGSVNVSNFPQTSLVPFVRQCTGFSSNCSINLTDLMEMGGVHITHVSGQALNVGATSSPRFSPGGFTEINLPHTVNSLDTGVDRDIQFSQSMDVIPVGTSIEFVEPQSTEVFFKIAGHVVESSTAASAVISGAAIEGSRSFAGSTKEP